MTQAVSSHTHTQAPKATEAPVHAGNLRPSGLELIGDVPWGTHFCQFYQTKQDLIDTLVPYMVAGLQQNEFCMWITSEPLSHKEAEDALRRALPNLDDYLRLGQIEILPHDQWYVIDGVFDSDRVLAGWVTKLGNALAKGFDGLRLTGNTFWLEKSGWLDFTGYEEMINSVIGNYNMMALCTYSVDRCSASEVADVVINHQFALMKRAGVWSVIESSDYKQTRLALQASNAALEATNRRLELLSETSARLLDSDEPQEVVQELCERMLTYLDCQAFFNYLVDEERGCLHLNACAGIPKQTAKDIEWLDYGVAVCGCVARDGQRIVCEHILENADPRTELVKSFGIQAYACNPLIGKGGKVIGTLSFGTSSRPAFSENDVSLMETVASQVAIAMQRVQQLEAERRLAREAEERRQDLDRAQAVSHTGSWRLNTRKNELVWSDEAYRIFDVPRGTALTYESFLSFVHPDDRAYVDEQWQAGVRGAKYEIEHRILVGASTRWVHETAELEFDENGELMGGFGTVQDITGQKQTEQALATANDELKAEVDERKRAEPQAAEARTDAERHAAELQSFLSSMAEGFALFDAQGRIRWMNGSALQVLGISSIYPYDDWLHDYKRFDLQGKPLPDNASAVTRALAGETAMECRECVETPLGNRVLVSTSASPVLDSSGRVTGATAVFRDVQDVVRLENLRSELYEREHRIAEVLQSALIPPQRGYEMPGCRVWVEYKPAWDEADVGGDFYDVFRLPGGRLGILIGDVAGKGLLAAMRVFAARYAVRSCALLNPSPARALELANGTLVGETDEEQTMLTAFFAVLDVDNGAFTYASAGHEPPVLIRADGLTQDLELGGAPLGISGGLTYEDHELALEPEDVVVMVTDGITEARVSDGFFGREGIYGFLTRHGRQSCKEIAEGLIVAAVEHEEGRLRDDAAIVVVEVAARSGEVADV